MSDDFLPQWRPEPGPVLPNALERLMARAADDPSRHGEMFRRLMRSELCLLMPADFREPGSHEMAADSPVRWCAFADAKGPFTPVFTSFAVAEERVRKLPPGEDRVIAGMAAKALFPLLRDGQTVVRLVGPKGLEIILAPEAVEGLVTGSLTGSRPTRATPQRLTLHELKADSLPPRLVGGIRRFCDARKVPIGVYAFLATDPESGEIRADRLHLMVRLRNGDNPFYHDFSLMSQRLAMDLEIVTGVVTDDNEESLAFLAGCTPLWPVL